MNFSRWCFVGTLLFAAATIVFTVLFGTPPEPVVPMAEGFKTPMLALEFARGFEDLVFLQGDGAQALREHLQNTQELDRFFPIAYAGMAAVFFLACATSGRAIAWLGVIVAIATIPADWAENVWVDALILAANPDFAGEAPGLAGLQLTTWIKWGLIGAYAALLAVLMIRDKRPILAIPGAVAALAILATWLSGSNGQIAEIMSLTLLPFMLTFPVAAVLYLRSPIRTP
jgi:hypothetical protein